MGAEPLTKRCTGPCQMVKSIDEFHVRRSGVKIHSRQSYCKPCGNARSRQWRLDNPERSKQLWREASKRWGKNHPEEVHVMDNVHDTVRRAIASGKLERSTSCERCGATNCRIEAAHYDYSKPLQVAFLCVPCHVAWDKRDPKSKSIKQAVSNIAPTGRTPQRRIR